MFLEHPSSRAWAENGYWLITFCLEQVQTLSSRAFYSPHGFMKFFVCEIFIDCWMIVVNQLLSWSYRRIIWWIAITSNGYTLPLTIHNSLMKQTLVSTIAKCLTQEINKKRLLNWLKWKIGAYSIEIDSQGALFMIVYFRNLLLMSSLMHLFLIPYSEIYKNSILYHFSMCRWSELITCNMSPTWTTTASGMGLTSIHLSSLITWSPGTSSCIRIVIKVGSVWVLTP